MESLFEGLKQQIRTISFGDNHLCIFLGKYKNAAGGIRMIPGIQLGEVILLAIAMDLKWAAFYLPISGAKVGINAKSMCQPELNKFLSKIKPLLFGIKNEEIEAWFPNERQLSKFRLNAGPDIGTSEEMYLDCLKELNFKEISRKGILSKLHPSYGLPFDNITTGFSVIVAAAEIFRILEGMSAVNISFEETTNVLNNKTYALEGFGKVGSGIAKLLEDKCHLLAISTQFGMINYDPENKYCSEFGFIPSKIIALRSQYGDKFIFQTGLKVLKNEELFSVQCDFLIPGARTEVITRTIAEKIFNAGIRVIVPASNFPYTIDGLAYLESNGIICVPDFISNAGAVICSMVESSKREFRDDMAFSLRFIQRAISLEMRKTIEAGIKKKCKFGLKYNSNSTRSMYQFAIKFTLAKKENLYLKKMNQFKAFINRYMPEN